ncbi:MAG: hypothetical protein AAFZ15_31195 [Bacteroidota bacterium]
MKNTFIVDATLREGKQSLRRDLSARNILLLAEKIVSLGIDQLEVGHAAISAAEINMLKQIKTTFPEVSLMTHARAIHSDIQQAIAAQVDWIGIFISTNGFAKYRINNFSVEKIMEQAATSVEFAKANGLKVRFTIEDSSRTDSSLLLNVYECAIQMGADRICLADTLGIMDPKEVDCAVRMLTNWHNEIPLEVHFHNDRGLAMANSLQAIESGAQWVSSSVNGIGERSGITDTCLLLANLHHKGLRPLPAEGNIKEASELVASTTRLAVDAHRPVVGNKAFLHVAKLHVNAMKKNPASYNWTEPALFGQQTRCIEKLPPFQLSDLIIKPVPLADTKFDYLPLRNGNDYQLFNAQQIPDANVSGTVKNIALTDIPQLEFEPAEKHNVDRYSIFIGKNDHLEGLTCEVQLDDEIFLINSPATIFIPAGIAYSYRIMNGEGFYFNHVLKGNDILTPTQDSSGSKANNKLHAPLSILNSFL